MGERETEHERGRGRERGRHRIRNRLQALSHQPRARRGARQDHTRPRAGQINKRNSHDFLSYRLSFAKSLAYETLALSFQYFFLLEHREVQKRCLLHHPELAPLCSVPGAVGQQEIYRGTNLSTRYRVFFSAKCRGILFWNTKNSDFWLTQASRGVEPLG